MEKKGDRTKGKRTNPTETGPHRNPLIDRLGRRRQSSRNVAEERQKKKKKRTLEQERKSCDNLHNTRTSNIFFTGVRTDPTVAPESELGDGQSSKSKNLQTLKRDCNSATPKVSSLFACSFSLPLSFSFPCPRSFIFLPRSLALHTSPFAL